MAAERTGQG